MTNEILWWIGAIAAGGAGVGVAALAWVWAIEKVIAAFGFSRIIAAWYIDGLIKKRDAKRVRG